MKKTGVILVLLIALTALVFFNTGCKPKEVAKEPVKIEFWTTETQSDRMSTIQLLADTFQAVNPDIEVVVVPVDENDMPKQVASASAAGRMPALADFDPELSDKTGFAPKISKLQPAGFGVVVSLGFFKQDDPANTEAAKKFVKFLYTDDAYITFLHMAPGGMYPMLKKIAASEQFLNDPNGIYKHYGKAKMAEIVSGLENLMRFDVVEGNLIKDYGKISTQQIIPQMMYKITQEGVSVDKAMSWAEGEMKKAIE